MSWSPASRRRRSLGIFGKMFAFGLLLAALAMVAVVFLVSYVFETTLARQLRPIQTWIVTHGFAEGSPSGSFLQQLHAEGRVRVTFYGPDGARLAATAEPYAPLDPAAQARVQAGAAVEIEDRAALAVPTRVDGRISGYGIVGFAEPGQIEVGPLSLVALLATIALIAWPVAASLTRPMRLLSETVRRFGDGDLGTRVAQPGGDEVGHLGHTFNAMADRVQDSIRSERLLVAAISHELRTPLQRVCLALELAADSQQNNPQLKATMADLDDLDRIVADVLVYSRLDGSTDSTVEQIRRREVIGTEALVADCLERFGNLHPDRDVRWHIQPSLPAVSGDARLLRRALLNLLENASRYSPSGSPIQVDATCDKNAVVIEVIDQGSGIPPDQVEAIFQPFVRQDQARSTPGSGLGLAIVKRIVEAHGGRVEVDSSPAGSAFRLVVPAQASASA